MKKVIFNKFDKGAISSLPIASFAGRIIVINTVGEARKAVDYLLSQSILGFDTETRPTFRRGQPNIVSLLQVATHDVCFLFRLNIIGVTTDIIRLLEDTEVLKIGLSWHDDITALSKRAAFNPGWFIDVQPLVHEIGIEDQSLQKLYANLFGQRIVKREQLSNWAAATLTEKQKLYAATDAWACIMLYEEVERLKLTRNFELTIVEPATPDQPVNADNESPAPKEAKKKYRKTIHKKEKEDSHAKL